MPFQSPLNVELFQGQIGGRLLTPLIYHSPEYDVEVIVEQGFECDFASVPSFLLDAIVNPIGSTSGSAVVHDWLYRLQGKIENDFDQVGTILSRAQVDDMFRLSLIESGYSKARAWFAWCGVRIGGWKPWKSYG